MKLWRVEDRDGIGMHSKLVAPYDEEYDLFCPSAFNQAILVDWCPFDDDLGAHPPPEDDFLLQQNLANSSASMEDYLFSFSSAQQMRKYLYKDTWIKRLDEFGMQVSVYWVDEGAILGEHQVLIPKGIAPLERYPIGEYFGLNPQS